MKTKVFIGTITFRKIINRKQIILITLEITLVLVKLIVFIATYMLPTNEISTPTEKMGLLVMDTRKLDIRPTRVFEIVRKQLIQLIITLAPQIRKKLSKLLK